jgi:hypothetical protein
LFAAQVFVVIARRQWSAPGDVLNGWPAHFRSVSSAADCKGPEFELMLRRSGAPAGGMARDERTSLEQALRIILFERLSLISRGPSTFTHRVSNRQREFAMNASPGRVSNLMIQVQESAGGLPLHRSC